MKYDIEISGEIGWWPNTSGNIRAKLSEAKGKPVAVRIASPGGSVADALDIFQQFRDHGQVTAYLYGPVASAATIIAMGAAKVVMSRYSLFLVHKVRSWTDQWGYFNADEITALIDALKKQQDGNDKFDNVLVAMYCNKTGKSAPEIKSLLSEDKWMSAEEAKEWGFIDEVSDDGKPVRIDSHVNDALEMLGLPRINDRKTNLTDEIARLARQLVALVKGRDDDEAETIEATNPTNTNTNTNTIMTDQYASINTLLGIDGLETSADGSVQLTAAQLGTINSRLAEAGEELRQARAEIAALNAQIEALNAQPGADDKPQPDDEEDTTDYVDIALKATMY